MAYEYYMSLIRTLPPQPELPQDYDSAVSEVKRIRSKLDSENALIRKLAIGSFVKYIISESTFEYSIFPKEAVLSNTCEPPKLEKFHLHLLNETTKKKFYQRYNEWINILNHSQVKNIRKLKERIKEFYSDYGQFALYVAVLNVHVSFIDEYEFMVLVDGPQYDDENKVVTALEQWGINDINELNVSRILYCALYNKF